MLIIYKMIYAGCKAKKLQTDGKRTCRKRGEERRGEELI
jgi:hypothetical protein